MYMCIYVYDQFHYSVFHRINIKGGGVHQWYMTFGQQCSISVLKQYFQHKLTGGGARLKGGGAHGTTLWGKHCTIIITSVIHYMYNVYDQFHYSVFHRINIKGGGVHQWYMTFGQQCSISVLKQYFQHKLTGGGARLKGGGAHGTTLWGKHCTIIITSVIHYMYNVYDQFHYNYNNYVYMYTVVITLCIFLSLCTLYLEYNY